MGLLMVNSLLFQNMGVLGFFSLSFLNDSFTGNVFLFDLFLLVCHSGLCLLLLL